MNGDKETNIEKIKQAGAQWLKGHIMGHLADNRWTNDL